MKKTLIIYGILTIVLLLILEYVVELNYLTKQLVRIPLMLIGPYFLLRYFKSPILSDIKFSKPTFKELRFPLIASLVVYLGAIGGYAIIYLFSDPSSITDGLLDTGVTLSNIWYVGIYMSIVNGLLEEFYFRGFVYMSIRKSNEVAAYLVSSFLFAIFHLGIVSVYFEPFILILLTLGLMIVGAFLIFINRFGKGLLNSWIVHIFADLAMFSIGLYLFLQ